MVYEIYTDGATSNNGYENSYGGWAWVLVEGDNILLRDSGFIDGATNNICELTAIAEACERVIGEIEDDDKVIVYSDSAYCVNCYLQKWYKRPQSCPYRQRKRWQGWECLHIQLL